MISVCVCAPGKSSPALATGSASPCFWAAVTNGSGSQAAAILRLPNAASTPPGPFVWTAAWGNLVFVSGLRGIDPATGEPAADDESRLRLIFAHLRRALEANGSSLTNVLSHVFTSLT
jgi:hypothetical protein